jgi:hypothetical protein
MASADRKAGGNRAVSFARGALVVVSVAIPLALIASTHVSGTGPMGVDVPEEIAAVAVGTSRQRIHRGWKKLDTPPFDPRAKPITHVKYPHRLGAPPEQCKPREHDEAELPTDRSDSNTAFAATVRDEVERLVH